MEIPINQTVARGGGAEDFFTKLSLPALHIDRAANLFMVNAALTSAFGYEKPQILEDIFKNSMFFSTHFDPPNVAKFFGAAASGLVEKLLLEGRALDGRRVVLEVNARVRLDSSQWRIEYADMFFTAPSHLNNIEALLEEAKVEASLAVKAKNEFLSNISHELRTPLNIIIGMLNMAVEDETIGRESRDNLALAKDAAEGLFSQLNDLILLSNLEARRLTSESAQFTPELLVTSITRKFAATAQSKEIALAVELDEFRAGIFEGGYNLIHLALEKLVGNAIKFSGLKGRVLIRATVELREECPWLSCEVSDNGPGLDECILEGGDELFIQGDSSMSRAHGGLGLGLRLTGALIRHLGGDMRLGNNEKGGANPSFSVPIRFSTVEFVGRE